MKKSIVIACLGWSLAACDVVQFQQQQLYSTFEKQKTEEASEAIIFSDATGTMWNSLFHCGDFQVTREVAYQGNSSIKLSWDKSKGCEWLGFGNSFSNWAAVDMSEARMRKALTFYVRTQEKTAGGLPIVAAMEDFGGGGSYHFIDTKKYLRGLFIDTTWKQVIVPLWDFPVNEEQVDIYSIKQMQFQLEGGGSFYLDEIKIIDYTPEQFNQFRAEVEAMKPVGNLNQIVYNPKTFDFDVWGHGKSRCQNLRQKNNIIHWTFNADNCSWAKWGINWNEWYQVNFRGILDKAVLEIQLNVAANTQFKMTLEDFNYNKVVLLDQKFTEEQVGQKLIIRLELDSKQFQKAGMQLDQIKQLLFEGQGEGEVEISSIKIKQK